MEFSSCFNGFAKTYGFQEVIRGGGSSSNPSLVLDGERSELVKAMVRQGQKRNKAEKALAALRNHSEAERRRRERINGHLATLRSLIPGTDKMDKAALLLEGINKLKELRKFATEAAKGILVPMDNDEVRVERNEQRSDVHSCTIRASVCCDYKQEILSNLKQAVESLHLKTSRAEIATLEGRMVYDIVITCCNTEDEKEVTEVCDIRTHTVRHALSSVLDKFHASEEISSRNAISNKRRRVPPFNPTESASLNDFFC